MDNLAQQLNYDFVFQISLFNSVIDNLKTADKNLAIEWANKLKSSTSTIEEAHLRNDFIFYLNKSCQSGELKAPFREKPPKGTLLNFLNLLPPEARNREKTGSRSAKLDRKAELFERSPDKGAFLASQPVPRCGAFCYLAVISKPPDET